MPVLSLLAIAAALILLAFLAAIRLSAAILVITALLPAYLLRFSISSFPTNVFEISVLVTLAVSLLLPSSRSNLVSSLKKLPSPALFLIFLFLVSALISTSISPHPQTSLGILKSWIIIPLLYAWLISTLPRSFSLPLANILILTGTAVSLFALLQLGTVVRLRGFYDVPNSLALFLAPLAALAWQLMRFVPASIITVALLATQSASAIIALPAAFAIYPVLCGQYRLLRRLLPALLIFLLLALALFTATGRLSYLLAPLRRPEAHNSVSVRFQLWSISLGLLKKHPFFGTGLGTFEPAYQQELHRRFQDFENCKLKIVNCRSPLPEFVFRDPHNWLLSFYLNLGLLGFISFVALNIYALRQGIAKASGSPVTPAFVLALLTLLVFGLFDTIYWKNDLAALHWLLLIFLLAPVTESKKD